MSASLPDAQWPLFEKMARYTVEVTNAKKHNTGTGVVISRSGLILTAQHVVAGCKRARIRRCRLSDDSWDLVREGRYAADVIHEDKNADIAVLLMRKPPKSLTAAPIGDSTGLRVGEAVYRLGMDEHVMDGGHVIAMQKTSKVGDRRLRIPVLTVSIRSNVGASGGPIFDTALELVAISHSVSSSEKEPTVSYSIPIDAVVRRLFRLTKIKTHLSDDE